AREHPAPAATPLIEAMIGFGRLRIERMRGLYLRSSESRSDLFPPPDGASFKSCPEQNAFPSPVITIHRIESFFAVSLNAFCRSVVICSLKALYTSGRLREIV